MLSAFPNLIGPILRLMAFWWVSIKKQCMTYDMATGSINKYGRQHVPISKGSLDNWQRLTGTFLEIWPRKGYATRQTCSWPAFHNLLALSPLMILNPLSPFEKQKGLMEPNKAVCVCVCSCVCLCETETQGESKPLWLCVTAWWGLGLWFLGEVVQSKLY